MRELETDVAIIGAGTAGLNARKAAVACGARTLLIDHGPWGTTCVRVGCMPSKLLLAAAEAARAARQAGTFGVLAGDVRVDGAAVMRRVRGERDHFLSGITGELDAIPAAEKLEGAARFAGPGRLRVGDDVEVRAAAVVIATGAVSTVPEALAPVRERVLTHATAFDLQELPRSLAVVGAGPLGIEFAIAFSRLGVRVSVFDEGDKVGGLKDPEVGAVARRLLGEELDLKLNVTLRSTPDADGARLSWTGDEPGEAVFERVLAAAGRPPDLKPLELEAAGLALDDRGAPEHDSRTQRCGEHAVFIAGDAAGDLPVLHEASRQGSLAGRNAAHPDRMEAQVPPAALSIVFTDPDLASIGQPLSALDDPAVGCCDFGSGRARIQGRRPGLIRLYADRAGGRLLGGEMAGPAVEHLSQTVAVLVQEGVTVERALHLPFYHPTYEEDLRDCLRDLRGQLAG